MRRPGGRLATLLVGVPCTLALASVGLAQMTAAGLSVPRSDDMVLGRPPRQGGVVEYASLGCPHCATWANEVFPAFRKAYVDTGKARFVLRELLYGNSTMAAAGFMLARCAGPRGYFPMVEAIFADQIKSRTTGVAEMLRVAKTQGFTRERFKACLKDPKGIAAVRARADRHQNADHVTATPTFMLPGGGPRKAKLACADLTTAIDATTRRR